MSAVVNPFRRHAVKAQEYLRMGEAGVFAPEARLGLIEGEIVETAPFGRRHAGVLNALNRLLSRVVLDRALVSVQNPVVLGDRSVPQPELALLEPRSDNYSSAHPRAADVLLVVELADTTLAFDTGTKLPLYARGGVREAWVVDLRERAVHVYRDPSQNGERTHVAAGMGESLGMLALPGARIAADALFAQ